MRKVVVMVRMVMLIMMFYNIFQEFFTFLVFSSLPPSFQVLLWIYFYRFSSVLLEKGFKGAGKLNSRAVVKPS